MSAKDREDLRAQYAASVQVWLTQGEMFWQRFNVMLVIHGAILAGIASTSSSQLKLILPVAGMLLAVGQILQQYRGIAYNLVFRETAIACEELLGGVQPLSSPSWNSIDGLGETRGCSRGSLGFRSSICRSPLLFSRS
jgi:hypothetical protein